MKTPKITLKLISLIAGGTLLSLMSVRSIHAQTESVPSEQSQHTMHHPENSADTNVHGMKMMHQQDMDQHFLMMMVGHAQTELAMADLALNKAESSELKTLAQSVKSQRNQTILDMKTWYKDWYKTDLPETSHMSMNHQMPMDHEMSMNHEMPMDQEMGMNHEMPMDQEMGMNHEMPMNQEMGMNHEMPMAQEMGMNHAMPMQDCMGMMGKMMNFDVATLENAEDFDQSLIAQMIRLQKMDVMMAAMVLDSSRPELRDFAQSMIQTKSMAIKELQKLQES
jgi:uncharacterized protein (DUF305 family)